jgi:uncharacterized protein YmfQ (DUF2313 family)
VALKAVDYLGQLQALLPRGLAWSLSQTAKLTSLLLAWADEFARIDLRADELVDAVDPSTTIELLNEWEIIAGLPDPCVSIVQSLEQRRIALLSKLTSIGGQSRAYFISVAAAMGYPGATIDEFMDGITCNDDCNDFLGNLDAIYIWRLNLPFSTSGRFVMTCNSDCNSALQSWGDAAIECRINQLKPAHTTVLFAYP